MAIALSNAKIAKHMRSSGRVRPLLVTLYFFFDIRTDLNNKFLSLSVFDLGLFLVVTCGLVLAYSRFEVYLFGISCSAFLSAAVRLAAACVFDGERIFLVQRCD